MSDNNDKDVKKGERLWWKPTSFKEFGGALLSAALVILLFWVACKTFGMMNVLPQAVNVGNTVQVVDTYARSRDLLSTLFPLFGAVVTFWLGVAVEGKRADQNKETADKANQDLTNTQEKDKKTRATLAGKVGEEKALVFQLEEIIKARPLMKAAGPDPMTLLDKIMSSLEEVEEAIRS